MKVIARISYKKTNQIGKGEGMNSEVFLAEDPQINGVIAVKEIPKAKFGNDPDAFYEEARIMFKSKHSNIVPIHYACTTKTHVCLAMPYFPRGSLAASIEKGPLSIRESLRIIQGVLTGLANIHLSGVIHFDIKPSNILINENGMPLIADFGQSRRIQKDGLVSTPPLYAFAFPPEIHASQVGGPHSDVYQAGILLYRLVNGEPHYQEQLKNLRDFHDLKMKIKTGKFPDRKRYLSHVPARLRTTINKALQIDPKKRFQSATEFADKLATVMVDLDWNVKMLSNGEFEWIAERGEQPKLIVELQRDGRDLWKVRAFTERNGNRRAKERQSFWRDGMTHSTALAHLEETFKTLA